MSVRSEKSIPKRYRTILDGIKENSSSSKIRFKIMDILGE